MPSPFKCFSKQVNTSYATSRKTLCTTEPKHYSKNTNPTSQQRLKTPIDTASSPHPQNPNSKMTIAQINSVTSPADITPDLLSDILEHPISACEIKPLGKGVLSNVQVLTITYDKSICAGEGLPTRFIAKFKKEDIPLPDLFSVEGEFYRLCESLDKSSNMAFPFKLVRGFATGPCWLLLEYIPHSEIILHDVHEGCPYNLFDDLVVRLAKLHSSFWLRDVQQLTDCDCASKNKLAFMLKNLSRKLSATPGCGHSLPTNVRQNQFLPAWPAVRERLALYITDESSLGSIDNMVDSTAKDSRIEKCSTRISKSKFTLVHGDYHIGNVLSPNNVQDPWLVDWSMAGLGNPLIDLVFFLVVGAPSIPVHQCDADKTAGNVEFILHQYITALNETEELLSWDELVNMFRLCILNQFIILVCYDDLCRVGLSDSFSDDMRNVYHSHFDKVNVRCARLLISEFGWTKEVLD